MSSLLNQFGMPFRLAHAADPSRFRGPQFARLIGDIDRLITSSDRRTLASLSNRLYVNFGVIKAVANQRADYTVGEAFLPEYQGKQDQEAGERVADYMRDVWYPQCTTRGGVLDWWELLRCTSISIDRDGDSFWLLVQGDDGFPRIQPIPGHRCGGHGKDNRVEDGPFRGFRIVDGVIYFASGRPAAYQFDVGRDGKEVLQQIPASDVIHLYDPTYAEQGRGYPIFSHALDDMKDCMASTADERLRQVLISRLHLIIQNETGGADENEPLNELISGSNTEGLLSQNFPGGIYYQPAGQDHKIEQIKHENPGATYESFQNRLIAAMVVGSDWALSLAWPAAAPTQGTAMRADIIRARQAVRRRHGILWYGCRRAVSWAYSRLQEQAGLPALRAPMSWDFSKPPRITVDDGREAKMELDQVRQGTMTITEVIGGRGLTSRQFFRDRAREAAERELARRDAEAEFGVTIDPREMYPLSPNEAAGERANQPARQTKEDDDDDE
jgi:capsid protein